MDSNRTSPYPSTMDQDSSSTAQADDKSDNMDITITTAHTSSPEMDTAEPLPSTDISNNLSISHSLSVGGAGIPQPKVQTAFIHKLYNMLEDASIQHLISWAPSNESFLVTPTGEFSKVLSQYFKHTNISSFVRQLNMYGFHKVNDVFHSSAPDSALWEFKHGNGSFKRGDLIGLREIKRRASRHTLTHKDSFTTGLRSGGPTAPGTPNEQAQDNTYDSRLFGLEQTMWDMSQRMIRMEESNSLLSNRCQDMLESLTRSHQWTIDLSQFVDNMIPQTEANIRQDLQHMRKEVERHIQHLEEIHDSPSRERAPLMPTLHLDSSALSPRQRPIDDDGRRPPPALRGSSYFRPSMSSHLSVAPRRYGSMSGPSGPQPSMSVQGIPSMERPQPRPLATLQPPPNHLSRRHTSADIRLPLGQPSGINQQFFQPATQWGNSAASRARQAKEISKTSQMLASYEIQGKTSPSSKLAQHTPPPPRTPPFMDHTGSISESTWSFATATQGSNDTSKLDPPPPHTGSRRSSVVSSSVHALLNHPSSLSGANNATQAQSTNSNQSNASDRDSDNEHISDDRKRKRMI